MNEKKVGRGVVSIDRKISYVKCGAIRVWHAIDSLNGLIIFFKMLSMPMLTSFSAPPSHL